MTCVFFLTDKSHLTREAFSGMNVVAKHQPQGSVSTAMTDSCTKLAFRNDGCGAGFRAWRVDMISGIRAQHDDVTITKKTAMTWAEITASRSSECGVT